MKETRDWVEEHGATATAEDFEEQKEKLSGVAYPITSKLYSGASGGDDDAEEPFTHDKFTDGYYTRAAQKCVPAHSAGTPHKPEHRCQISNNAPSS